MSNEKFFGYFIGAEQTPRHDPGLDVDCPFCSRPLGADVANIKTVSLAFPAPNDTHSYFYRCHKSCYEAASEKRIGAFELSAVDKRMGVRVVAPTNQQ